MITQNDIIPKYSTANTTYQKNRPLQYIVWHYTAGISSKKGNAISNALWFGNPSAQASADFVVDDVDIVQVNGDIPNRYCWAVGGSKYSTQGGKLYGVAKNANCISIEICSNNSAGKITFPNDIRYSFTEASLANALKLTEYLMDKYKIDSDHVIRHYDVNGKPCPGIIGWNKESGSEAKWDIYKKKIKEFDEKTKMGPVTDKIWMGWIKRESGKYGYRQTNGSSGTSYGLYQFDYRYSLVPFMQDCVKHSDRYEGFNTYIKYGTGSSKLVNNKWLAELWEHLYDAYADEFSALQDRFAYQQYYLPAKKALLSKYGIDCSNKSPAYKGSLFSMAIRSGTENAAARFKGTGSKSDADAMAIAYSTYGTADDKRWTKENQYGDALKALSSNEYTVVSADPEKLYIAGDNLPAVIDWYRVGTAWANGKCVNQAGAFEKLDGAKAFCDEISHGKGLAYKVYDSNGKIAYEAEYDVSGTLYTVYVNKKYQLKINCQKCCDKIKAKGIDATPRKVGNRYQPQCGVFSIKSNAYNVYYKLTSLGYEAEVK